jgi:hypothetical protein
LHGVVVVVVTARISAWESVMVRCLGWHLGSLVEASLWVTLSRSAVACRAGDVPTIAEVRGLCQFLNGGGDDQVD